MILKRKDKPKTNYTVVSNAVLRDPSLSLKAKGMLTQLISLPEDWNVSIRGLQTLSSDRAGSLKSALDELKDSGYISSVFTRGRNGSYRGINYQITDKAYGLPCSENPYTENPCSENRTLLNKEIQNKKEINKEKQKYVLRIRGLFESG